MAVKITHTRVLETGTHVSVRDLRELLAGVDDGTQVTINQRHGGQLDGTSTTLTVNMLNQPARPVHSGTGRPTETL